MQLDEGSIVTSLSFEKTLKLLIPKLMGISRSWVFVVPIVYIYMSLKIYIYYLQIYFGGFFIWFINYITVYLFFK